MSWLLSESGERRPAAAIRDQGDGFDWKELSDAVRPLSVEPLTLIIMAGFPRQIKKLTELSLEATLMSPLERGRRRSYCMYVPDFDSNEIQSVFTCTNGLVFGFD
jgi:hypothetical protein